MSTDPETIPVIVGIGQVNDRPGDPLEGMDSVELMIAALREAGRDAGGDNWLADADSLAIVSQLSFPHLNPALDTVCEALGASPAHRFQTALPNGDSPILLLHEAANRIGAGNARIALVTGGEALRTAGARARAEAATEGKDHRHNPLRDAPHRKTQGYRQNYGLTVPVDIYPLYENAGRTAYRQTLTEGQMESAAIWARMSQIASQTESAWIRTPLSAREIATPSENNRPIAFPYTKFTVANSLVNQGAGFIVTSFAEAQRRNVPENRLVFVGHGAAAHESGDFLARENFVHSPGMEVSIRQALKSNELSGADLDHVELYSCFPCVPKMARRILDWPADRDTTVFGGLTFGGGPIGNYMSHAVACMVERLRGTDETGLLFANGGYATHNHSIALFGTSRGHVAFPQDFDFQAEADEIRGPVPELDESYCGPATLETYTVHYHRNGTPRLATIVARTPTGARTLAAVVPDEVPTIAWLTSGDCDPVGSSGTIVQGENQLRIWQASLPAHPDR